MITKLFEIRDRNTFIPVLATKIDHEIDAQSWLLNRAGFLKPFTPDDFFILLCDIKGGGGECQTSAYDWRGRAMATAHDHIVKNWDQLKDGDVIDVEFILGETKVKKASERVATVYPRKGDWVEFGSVIADKTPADLAAENALCNAAYLAKKDD